MSKQAEQEQRMKDYIRQVVDKAPPLTPEQRSRLALLLTPPTPTTGALVDSI